ncbi:MAG TPA: hypothetical protein VGH07_04220, partial [Chthoniobacterales bacterium]
MEFKPSVSEWLPWLGRVRFLVITFLVGVVVAVHQLTPVAIPVRAFVSLVIFWYTLAVVYVILRRWIPEARWHAPLQFVCDLVIVTGVVYATGGQDSYFLSLYLLVILMSSVLFSRRGAFLVAGMSFVLLGCVIELMFYGVIARTSNSMPAARSLGFWLASNLFAFCAVAYLGSLLSQTLRTKGVELAEKNEELKDLQAFNQDIIEYMRGGLLTTDLNGKILLMNRAGAEIAGLGFGLLRGEQVENVLPGFWPVELDEQGSPLALRKEIEFRTPD